MDHPIEFGWLSSMEHHIQISELVAYARKHPTLTSIEKKSNVLNKLDQKYKEVSRIVHGQSIRHMQLAKSLEDFYFDQQTFDQQFAQFETITKSVNFLLTVLHYDEFRLFDSGYKKLILSTIERNNKRLLAEL
jgi:hypothetical protein